MIFVCNYPRGLHVAAATWQCTYLFCNTVVSNSTALQCRRLMHLCSALLPHTELDRLTEKLSDFSDRWRNLITPKYSSPKQMYWRVYKINKKLSKYVSKTKRQSRGAIHCALSVLFHRA